MEEWLGRLAGIDPDALGEGTRLEFAFSSLPRSWWALVTVVLLFLMVVTVLALYRREGVGSRWRKGLLALVRLTVLGFLVLILFGPEVVPSVEKVLDAYTVVLVDDSLSMSLRDRYEDPEKRTALASVSGLPAIAFESPRGVSRAELLEGLFNNPDLALLERLEAKNRVRLFTFSSTAKPVSLHPESGKEAKMPEAAPPAVLHEFTPKGASTSLSGGCRSALAQVGRPLAGVILLSDGRFNVGEGAATVGEFFRNRGIKAFT
ncbi:MAG: vWA domain-containing protein, partial [Planctomycetota bacterium]